MANRQWCVIALVVLAATSTSAASSNEFASPPPSLLFRLQTQNFGHPWLRVTTDSSRLTLRARRVDESGLVGIRSRNPESPAPDQLGWDAIARIDELVTRKRAGKISGFLLGGTVGAVLGHVIGGSMRSPGTDTQPPYGPIYSEGHGKAGIALGLAVVGGLGAWQGGRMGDRMVKGERSWYVAMPREASSRTTADPAVVITPSPIAVMPPAPDSPTAASPRRSTPGLVASQESPALGAITKLDRRLMRTRKVRITTGSDRFVAGGGRAGAEGLSYDGRLATAGADTLPFPGRVPWNAIVRVDVPGNHALRAAIVSAVVLSGAVGGALYAARGQDIGGGGAIVYAVPLGVGLAAGVGALLPAWHRVYHSRRTSDRGR